MANFKRFGILMMSSVATLALAGCDGADSVASPGEGVIIVPGTPAPSPTPSPTATPTPTGGSPAASCPTGFTDAGVLGSYRGCRLPSRISADLTLAKVAGVAYEMNGRVDVGFDIGGAGTAPDGKAVTLTIQPGVVVYANTTNADNDFLVVNRGSKINAEGSETAPIIFTAQANLTGGVTDDTQGLWGGVILAGRAPISNCNTTVGGGTATCENVVEGTSTALYGGAIATDSSGVFRYVQIRYSGTVISPNNELQGLTLGGTGSGTVIDHVQVHNSSDDGIEVFGGRTNMRYLVMTGADDDGLDTDVGWQGYVQFLLAIQKPNNTQTDTFSTEIDSNNSEDALPRQSYNLANFTFVETSTNTLTPAAIRLRGGADATFVNGIVVGPQACLNVIAGVDNQGKSTIRPANATLEDKGPPVFNSVLFGCATPYAETAVNGVTVTAAEMGTIFNAGSNNNANAGAGILTNTFFPAGAATTATAFNAATLNPANTSFLVSTTYVGAVSGANDTWFQRWTCNSNRASFGSASAACTAIPSS